MLFLDKPAAPEGPIEASEVKGEQMTLSWKPPKDSGGERVNNYILEKKKKGASKWSKVHEMLLNEEK